MSVTKNKNSIISIITLDRLGNYVNEWKASEIKAGIKKEIDKRGDVVTNRAAIL